MPAAVSPPLAPLVANQLNYLLSRSSLPFKVEQIRSGCKDGRFSDRFTLLVPFCFDYVKWDVIYNTYNPLFAPDIIFAQEDSKFNPLLSVMDGSRKSCLLDWNPKGPSNLLDLILELRELYLEFQKEQVSELDDERLKFEINTMLSRKGIEVRLISAPDRAEEVKFAVPLLEKDLDELMTGWPLRHPHVNLQVTFPVVKSYSSAPAPRLKLASSLDLKALFSIEDVKLPAWPDGMCMAEYLPALEGNIRMQVREAVALVDARRSFIEALAIVFGRPVEADPIFCRKATFLSASGVFTFLVHFSIPTQFPKQQPVLILQSSQHFSNQGAPILSPPINDCPWSPRWNAAQMAERIFDYLIDESQNFKKYCNDNTPQQQ